MKEPERHPFFENLVYGLALLMALIIVYYGLKRAFLAHENAAGYPSVVAHGLEGHGPKPAQEQRHQLVGSGMERSISELPAVEVSRRPGPPRHRATAVPSPGKPGG
jgi:hypothetical protein